MHSQMVTQAARRVAEALGFDMITPVLNKALEAAETVAREMEGGRWNISKLTPEESGVLDLQPSLGDGPSSNQVTPFADALQVELKKKHPSIQYCCVVRKKAGPEFDTDSVMDNNVYFVRVFLAEIQ